MFFKPANVDECLQKYVPKTNSEEAAKIVGGSCAVLFTEDMTFNHYAESRIDSKIIDLKRSLISLKNTQRYLPTPENGIALENTELQINALSIAKDNFQLGDIVEGISALKNIEAYSNVPNSELREAFEGQYRDYEEKQAEKKRKAKCTLGLKRLYKAQNKSAVRVIYSSSGCGE